jgi:hypothetical protein
MGNGEKIRAKAAKIRNSIGRVLNPPLQNPGFHDDDKGMTFSVHS